MEVRHSVRYKDRDIVIGRESDRDSDTEREREREWDWERDGSGVRPKKGFDGRDTQHGRRTRFGH